jgi:2-polyprenyl-6-methoxyphenol hydroxylase-like FAD-dependent oxidoreductase
MAVTNGMTNGTTNETTNETTNKTANGTSNRTTNGTTNGHSTSPSKSLPILISGGGCVGLYLALLLASSPIPNKIIVIEPQDPDSTATRAIAHQPHTYPILSRVPGLLPELLDAGTLSSGLSFRTSVAHGSKVIAEKNFDNSGAGLKGKGQIILPQGKFLNILLRRLSAFDAEKVAIKLGYSVTSCTSHPSSVSVVISHPDSSQETVEATYLLAADGAHSLIRKSLGIPLTGTTLDTQLIALDMRTSLFTTHNFHNANFIIDPVHYGLCSCIADDLWRVSFGMPAHLTEDEVKKGVDAKLEYMLPNKGVGQDGEKSYEVVRVAPYKAQQRLADTMYKSRVCLVGDAAHLTNPYAGLGLASGLADASSLAEVLEHILTGEARDSEVLLESWSQARRKKYGEAVDGPSRMAYERVKSDVSSEEKVKELVGRDRMIGALRSGMAVMPMGLDTRGVELEGW